MVKTRRFSTVGFLFSIGFGIVAGAALLAIQQASFALGEGPALPLGKVITVLVACAVIGIWKGWRRSTAWALEIVRFRQRCRKGRWAEVFGFAIGIAVFGAILGVMTSIPKWLPPAADNATEVTLIHVGMGVACGFFGGFLFQFMPFPRRPRY